MALKKHCDQCGSPFPDNAPSHIFTVVLEKPANGKPARVIHPAITHLAPATHEKADVCPACTIKNLTDVIAQLKSPPKAA